MSEVIPTREERREFLEQRRSGLGSSDIAKIVGLHPSRDAMDVYIDKVSDVDPSEVENIHLLRGIILEPIFADIYAEETGRKVQRVQQIEHPDEEWATANLDRRILSNGDRDTGSLEIKSPSRPVYRRYLEEGIPEHIIIQHQWQLLVTGYDWGSIAWGSLEDDRGPLQYIDREAHPLLQENLMERGYEFWHEHVIPGNPPDPEEWARKTRVELPDLPGETKKIDDEHAREWAREVVRRKEQASAWGDLYNEAKDAVVEFCKARGAKTVIIPGVVRLTASKVSGRTYPRWKQLKKHGALDPNQVEEIMEEAIRLADHEADREWLLQLRDKLLSSAELDFDAFEKQADDHYRPYISPQEGGTDDE